MASYCRLPCIAWFLKTGTIIWGETRSKQLRRWKESADSADCLLTKYLGAHNVKKSSLSSSLKYILDCHTHAITLRSTASGPRSDRYIWDILDFEGLPPTSMWCKIKLTNGAPRRSFSWVPQHQGDRLQMDPEKDVRTIVH